VVRSSLSALTDFSAQYPGAVIAIVITAIGKPMKRDSFAQCLTKRPLKKPYQPQVPNRSASPSQKGFEKDNAVAIIEIEPTERQTTDSSNTDVEDKAPTAKPGSHLHLTSVEKGNLEIREQETMELHEEVPTSQSQRGKILETTANPSLPLGRTVSAPSLRHCVYPELALPISNSVACFSDPIDMAVTEPSMPSHRAKVFKAIHTHALPPDDNVLVMSLSKKMWSHASGHIDGNNSLDSAKQYTEYNNAHPNEGKVNRLMQLMVSVAHPKPKHC
jgi:hypothetical protein